MTDTSKRAESDNPLRRVSHAVRSHPWVAVVLLAVAAAALVFSALIGLPVVVTAGLLTMVGVGALVIWASWTRWLVAVALSGVATFALIQLVPYGRAHSNPPVTGEPEWADARTRELMVNACFSCHSNEVDYPPYASVAPFSWGVQRHVEEGREAVNYSEFVTDPGEADESIEVIEDGEMPPAYFTRFGLHPEANLSDAEVAELIDGLRRTPGLNED